MLPGPRRIIVPRGILIHPAIWPQQTRAKKWGDVPIFSGTGRWFHIEHNVAWAEAYIHIKWHLDPCSRLATIDMSQKLGALPLFGGGVLGPHLTQCRLDRGLPPQQVAS